MTVQEVMTVLRLERYTVYRLIRQGRLKATKTLRGTPTFGGLTRTQPVYDIDDESVAAYRDGRHKAIAHKPDCSCFRCTKTGRRRGPHKPDCRCMACERGRNSEGLIHNMPVAVTSDTMEHLSRLARERGVSRSEFVRTAIECYLMDLEAV